MDPRQVDEQAKLAEELHGKLFSQEQVEPTGTVQVGEQEETQEQAAEQPEVQEVDTPHDDDLEELRKFKSRYLTLKGKYEAEVPRLQSELKEFKQNVFDRIETLAKPQAEADPQEVEGDDPDLASFKEEYGEQFYNTLLKLIEKKGAKGQEIAEALKPVEEKISSIEEEQYQTAQKEFKNYLSGKVEGWEKLWKGEDPGFLEFAKQSDPSGLYTYGDLLAAYNDRWEADKMAQVFNLYLDSAKQNKQKTAERNAQIAPSRTVTPSTPAPDQKQVWTKETIEEFKRADRQGKYDSETSMAMWNDLLAAVNENRIR